MSSLDRSEAVAEFVSATGCSCETAGALLAAHGWRLQPALAEALGLDVEGVADQERTDREVATALAADGGVVDATRCWERAADREHDRRQEELDRDLAAALAGGEGGQQGSVHEQRQLMLLQEQQRRHDEEEQLRLLSAFERKSHAAVPERAGTTASPAAAAASSNLSPAACEVRDLLERARLPQFVDVFFAHGYDEISLVRQMATEDWDEVGLKGGHRMKLREALREAPSESAPSAKQAAVGSPSILSQDGVDGRYLPESAEEAPTPSPSTAFVDTNRPPVASAVSPGPTLHSSVTPCQSQVAASVGGSSVQPDAPEPQISAQGADSHERGRSSKSSAEGLLALARGRTRSQQRRVIKDGKITFVDE